ncbi:MAG: hypothetical protein HW380_2766, partial [Magnetococcales bacterium]|nr:hypothetical protein [Magnetococcales bacterium]
MRVNDANQASCPCIGKTKFGKNHCGGPGGIIPPGGGLEAAAHKVFLLTLILILILIFLPPKGGLGAQPQGFDFVFLPEGHHVQILGDKSAKNASGFLDRLLKHVPFKVS